MSKREQYFVLDINESYRNIMFKTSQNENCKLHIALEDSKMPLFVDDFTIDLYVRLMNSNDEPINYNSESKKGNDLFFNLIFSEDGIYECELKITSDEGVLKAPSFYCLVKKSISGSGVEYTLIDSEGFILLDGEGYELKVRG